MQNIGLVACCKRKRKDAAPARLLYTSALFLKASAYCQARYDGWFILSAKHGLVAPDRVIEPYDCSLLDLSKQVRVAWGKRVFEQLKEQGLEEATFHLHAGKAYCEPLTSLLPCYLPMEGLGIGQQLAWYANATLIF